MDKLHALPQSRLLARWTRCLLAVACWVLGLSHVAAVHAVDGGLALDAALDQQVQKLALDAVRPDAKAVRRIEVSVGSLDARLHLAPCQRVEPYLPNGVRLWGKTRIGLRCTQGASAWNVFVPITVKAYGPALVASAVLPAGALLAAADLIQAEVDLAEDTSMAVNDTQLAVGRTLVRAMLPGQSLRQSHLKARQWFAAGETVKVVAQGSGFSVASEGKALTPGIEGQSARVRTESGHVLVGLPVAENRVELSL